MNVADKFNIEYGYDYVTISGAFVPRPSGVSAAQWLNGWDAITRVVLKVDGKVEVEGDCQYCENDDDDDE